MCVMLEEWRRECEREMKNEKRERERERDSHGDCGSILHKGRHGKDVLDDSATA